MPPTQKPPQILIYIGVVLQHPNRLLKSFTQVSNNFAVYGFNTIKSILSQIDTLKISISYASKQLVPDEYSSSNNQKIFTVQMNVLRSTVLELHIDDSNPTFSPSTENVPTMQHRNVSGTTLLLI